jgi:ribosome-associated protein
MKTEANLEIKKSLLNVFWKSLKRLVPKIRKATKIPKSAIRKRIKNKKNVSQIKKNRRKPNLD